MWNIFKLISAHETTQKIEIKSGTSSVSKKTAPATIFSKTLLNFGDKMPRTHNSGLLLAVVLLSIIDTILGLDNGIGYDSYSVQILMHTTTFINYINDDSTVTTVVDKIVDNVTETVITTCMYCILF
jgi:hypothetical protein